MWKKKLIWKNVALQFEVATPEDIEEEVITQKDSFVLKASFKDPDAAHVVNDLELTIKKRFVMDTSSLISPVVKQEPLEDCELGVAKGSESSRVSDLAPRKRMQTDAGMGTMVSAAENSSYPSNEVDKSGKSKSPNLGPRKDDDDKASSSKKIILNVVDESDREMQFSVRPSTKLSKLMLNYSSRLELDVSCFKFIFDGRRIMEDETVRQLEMKDGDTINVVFNGISFVPLTKLEKTGKEVRSKIQTEHQLGQQQHGSDHRSTDPRFHDGQNLLDPNGNRNFRRDVEKENRELERKSSKDRNQELETDGVQNGGGGVKRKSVALNVDSKLKRNS